MTDDRTKVLYLALDACDPGRWWTSPRAGHCPNSPGLLATRRAVETVAPYGTFVGSTWMTITTGTGGPAPLLQLGADRRGPLRPAPPAPGRRGAPRSGRRSRTAAGAIAVLRRPPLRRAAVVQRRLREGVGLPRPPPRHGQSFPAELLASSTSSSAVTRTAACAPPPATTQFAPCDYTHPRRAASHARRGAAALDLILRGLDAKHRRRSTSSSRAGGTCSSTVLGESHCVGHQLWHVHDVDHPRHDPAARRSSAIPSWRSTRASTPPVGEHLAAAGPDAACYVHLSHGMAPHYDGDHLLDEVLLRIDVADRRRPRRRLAHRRPARARRTCPSAVERVRAGVAAARPPPHRGPRPPGPPIPPGPAPDRAGSRSRTTRSSGRSGSTSSAGSPRAS